jgi:hypothetical protein
VVAVSTAQVESNLPEGWVPEGAAVLVIAKQDDRDESLWESIVPEFSIVGRGESADDAYNNALELLDDYLMLCAREGRAFEEAKRPVSPHPAELPLLRELLSYWIHSKVPHRMVSTRHREERYRVPLSRELAGVR